jgi:putative copper resistance protein D
MIFMIIMVALQWSRSDEREARRKDRQADRDGNAELNAYNERLAALDERSRQGS